MVAKAELYELGVLTCSQMNAHSVPDEDNKRYVSGGSPHAILQTNRDFCLRHLVQLLAERNNLQIMHELFCTVNNKHAKAWELRLSQKPWFNS